MCLSFICNFSWPWYRGNLFQWMV